MSTHNTPAPTACLGCHGAHSGHNEGGTMFIVTFGGALTPRRDMITHGSSVEDCGWVTRFRLLVPDHNPDITHGLHIFIGEASDPHRIHLSKDKEGSMTHGWKYKLDFWAYAQDVGGCVMIAVGHSDSGPSRCKVEIGRRIGNSPEDSGWSQRFVFWVKATSFA